MYSSVGDVDMGAEIYGKSLYLLLSIAINLKLLYKIKSIKKKIHAGKHISPSPSVLNDFIKW